MKKINKEILAKAKQIKLLLMDVDGVLTKGELIILNNGEEIKVWDIKDRFAFTMLQKSKLNLKLGWISGRASKQLEDRAKELKLDFLYQGVKDKLVVYEEILQKTNLESKNVGYIGDDWLDIPILKRAGFSACPKNAVKEVKEIVDYITQAESGCGVFREIVEIILKSHNKWNFVFSLYNK